MKSIYYAFQMAEKDKVAPPVRFDKQGQPVPLDHHTIVKKKFKVKKTKSDKTSDSEDQLKEKIADGPAVAQGKSPDPADVQGESPDQPKQPQEQTGMNSRRQSEVSSGSKASTDKQSD